MFRPFLALAALCLVAAAAPAQRRATDWSATARPLPTGGYLVGDPAARVKLIEYASYTCSHCAEFAVASKPVLKGAMIRSGSTSLELRHLIRDAFDLTAVVVARCAGPAGFSRTSDAIFAGQNDWLPRGAAYDQANTARPQGQPMQARLRALADGSGLAAIGRANGVTDARLAACFADRAAIDRMIAASEARPAEVRATPTFFLGGRQTPAADWAQLQPLLRAAGAK
ncbi:DsbA family protein [uncultured Sphingomonas sp.]|uniref:DsbA family protein n=1 Tax=uncultured Sphingomonas sp. TaxID=158754 RepID=UPI0035C9DB91